MNLTSTDMKYLYHDNEVFYKRHDCRECYRPGVVNGQHGKHHCYGIYIGIHSYQVTNVKGGGLNS